MAGIRLPVQIAAHLRLLTAFLVGVAVFLAAPHRHGVPTRALFAWDIGATLLLFLLVLLITRSTTERMRQRAAIQDAGRWAILAVAVAGALFSLLGLGFVQSHIKSADPGESAAYIGLIAVTILTAWMVTHAIFALHYAHDYYGPATDADDDDGLVGGLEFPGEKQPDYWDFMYFSFVIGMTCQVSDVQVSGRMLRRLALAHGVISFLFNTIILALTINIVASLI